MGYALRLVLVVAVLTLNGGCVTNHYYNGTFERSGGYKSESTYQTPPIGAKNQELPVSHRKTNVGKNIAIAALLPFVLVHKLAEEVVATPPSQKAYLNVKEEKNDKKIRTAAKAVLLFGALAGALIKANGK